MVHLQFPDENHGQNGECEVADDAEGAVEVGESDDDIHGDAAATLGRVIPEIRYRLTLQESDEEEHDAGANRHHHDTVNDPNVDLADRDSEEEVADGNFRRDHRQTVPQVAVPPELQSVSVCPPIVSPS